jgi:penicillin-binding protein 2
VKNKRLGEMEYVKIESQNLAIPKDIMDVVHQGMFDVVNTPGGTARAARMDSIIVAGKTGTAQAGKGKRDHAWFVCYAPFDKPKIAMCVLVENSGFGGTYSAPIARKLIRFYLTRKKEAEDTKAPTGTDELPNFHPDALPAVGDNSGDVQESDLIPAELR